MQTLTISRYIGLADILGFEIWNFNIFYCFRKKTIFGVWRFVWILFGGHF